MKKLLIVLFLVLSFSATALAQRATVQKMSTSTLAGLTGILVSTRIDGDIVIVDFQGDATYGYNKFVYIYDIDSEVTADSPFVLAPDTGAGRWILSYASEWPCVAADSNCYQDFPVNSGTVAAPSSGMVRLSVGSDGKFYSRAFGGSPVEIGTGGGGTWGSITGTLSTQTDLQGALDLKAPLASPALTGNPTAPTQTAGNNSTRVATTAYVDAAVVAGASGYVATPTYSDDTCTEGQWSFDASYIYICEGTDAWDRYPVTFASWSNPGADIRYLEDGTTTRTLEDGTVRRVEG